MLERLEKKRSEKQRYWLNLTEPKSFMLRAMCMPNFRLLRDESIQYLIVNRFLQGRNSISSG